MYLHFFNLNDQHNPGSLIVGPCFLNSTRGILRISPDSALTGSEVRTDEDGNYIVNGKRFADLETLESLDFAPADCQIITGADFMIHEDSLLNFVCHGTYAYSNACGYEVELSPDGESARLRINGNEPTATVTDWLPIEMVENDDADCEDDSFHPVIDPDGHNIPIELVMRIN